MTSATVAGISTAPGSRSHWTCSPSMTAMIAEAAWSTSASEGLVEAAGAEDLVGRHQDLLAALVARDPGERVGGRVRRSSCRATYCPLTARSVVSTHSPQEQPQ